METYLLTIQPHSAFGTPLAGDTLFGQLCWAVRERFGQARLTSLLEGYTEGRPFLAVSDAFPAGWLPRPQLPSFLLGRDIDPAQRKMEKQKVWLPARDAGLPLRDWLARAESLPAVRHSVVTQNMINRFTGTTGTGPFAPRQVSRLNHGCGAALDIYCVVDTSRLALSELAQVVTDIGHTGYGRDASTGLGKFALGAARAHHWPAGESTHALTLAPCAPEPAALAPLLCFYQPLTRFGRHGNVAALIGQPFKRPVLTLRTSAFLTFRDDRVPALHGTGLGGTRQPLSAAIPATVHQGYAPLVPLNAELRQ